MGVIAEIRKTCRICGFADLESVLDFGSISLTGVFEIIDVAVPTAEMHLGRCVKCGLVQLLHTYNQEYLYGASYGYESHLNSAMAQHLKSKAASLESRFFAKTPSDKQIVAVDIASNDGTLLAGYSESIVKVGIDPLINIVDDCYPSDATKINEFFTSESYFNVYSEKADLVTSLSVIYDLDDPISFAKGVFDILKDGGIWHLEQSYLPSMCSTLSYDTICHEHLLYLSLHDIRTILDRTGFQILDVSLNDVNGGSIAVTAIKGSSKIDSDPFVEFLLAKEIKEGYQESTALAAFASRARLHKAEIAVLIKAYREKNYKIYALGASTKGNVLLQWAGLTSNQIEAVGDINPKKYGKRTPGTDIPIISESEIIGLADPKTIVLVLPWHFRSGIIRNCRAILDKGAKFLLPLPSIEIVSS